MNRIIWPADKNDVMDMDVCTGVSYREDFSGEVRRDNVQKAEYKFVIYVN